MDYGLIYYRTTSKVLVSDGGGSAFRSKLFSNLYQVNLKYPLDRIRSIRFNVGFRSDKIVILADDLNLPPLTLEIEDFKERYSLVHAEYVHDDAINPALNIWNGLRFKLYMDWNAKVNKTAGVAADNKFTFNVGGDGRYYLPIYRNCIWAVRGAFDLSWGGQKII